MDTMTCGEKLSQHFNIIKFTKPIPKEEQLNEQELDEKLREELPYFLAWLAKSRKINIIK